MTSGKAGGLLGDALKGLYVAPKALHHPESQLVTMFIRFLLIPDVLSDHLFIQAYG